MNPQRRPDSYSLYAWSVDRGLPSDKVRSIVQTRDGYLWLATAHGLSRFDGIAFTNYTGATNPELRGGGFFAVLETPDGTLWAGGDNGLFRWRQGHFDRFTTADGLAHNYVRALALTSDGGLAVCTRLGFSFVRKDRITTPGGIWRQPTGVARAYAEGPDGAQYLGTDDGLWRIRGTRIERLSGEAGLPARGFQALERTNDGSVWIGHSEGVRRLKIDGTVEDLGAKQGLKTPRVVALRHDHDENLWIASAGGLYRFSGGRLEAAPYASAGLNGPTIQQLYEDREGALWIASAIGLMRLEDNMATSIGPSEGLNQTSVFAVLEGSDRLWWIGLWNGGVYRYDQKRATRLAPSAGSGPEQVLALAEAPAGTMWFGAVNGLYRWHAGEMTNLYRADLAAGWQAELARQPGAMLPGLAHARVNAVASHPDGSIWVGAEGALYHSEKDGFRVYTKANGLPDNDVRAVFCARNGDVWVSTPPTGVARLHEGKWSVFLAGRELSPVYPRGIYEDSDGTIWIATDGGGINRWRKGQWRTLTTQDGLADDFITGIVEDKRGNFWLGCPWGVMRIERGELTRFDAGETTTLHPRLFGRSDGLPAGEPNQQGSPSACRTKDGRLLFATDRGVAVIEPDHLTDNRVEPPVYVERITVNGADVDLSRSVVIPPGSNDVVIHYTAIETLAAENVRFRIRLSPLDKDWIDTGARRDVRYAKLPPGRYEFAVVATNNAGVWSNRGASIDFVVQPFFYQTFWFWVVVVAAALGAVGLAFWLRARLERRRRMILEQVVDERTRALKQATRAAEAAVQAKSEVIAALRVSEEETALERARLKFIFDAVPIGLAWMIRDDPKSHLMNSAFARITGLPLAAGADLHADRLATHPEDRVREDELREQLLAGKINQYAIEKRYVHSDGSLRWGVLTVRSYRAGGPDRVQLVATLVDATERKETEARLKETNQRLLETSRQAGMAEVATGVLHNVGNVLNSVTVSTSVLASLSKASKIDRVAKLGELLREHAANLGEFVTNDPRGQRIPAFVDALAEHLAKERADVQQEIAALQRNVDHIKQVVAMQQGYARVAGVLESVHVIELVEDALRINEATLERHRVRIVREYEAQPTILTERHRVIQILVNLVQNAKLACQESGRDDSCITVRVTADAERVRVIVSDNGVGIAPENLTRIFSHGFTTRINGHGFGLHSGALAARELGGSLAATSEGPGKGASFSLELPVNPRPA